MVEKIGVNLAFLLLFLLFSYGCTPQQEERQKDKDEPKVLHFIVHSYKETVQILDNIGYSEEAFKRGMKRVPRVIITHISKRWGKEAQKLSVETKKSIFLRLMASGALLADEEILKEREALLKLVEKLKKGPVSRERSEWLRMLALKYRVLEDKNDLLTWGGIKELIKRVDIVPPTIVVAQGAVESGWGTSRFAMEGNALFGQWSFSKSAMKPKEQRSHLGDYGLASFKSPMDSIRSYLLNLNTHPAYRGFRNLREQLRAHKEPLKGEYLLFTLKSYSERGWEYIEELERVIRANGLKWLDLAKLGPPPLVLIEPSI